MTSEASAGSLDKNSKVLRDEELAELLRPGKEFESQLYSKLELLQPGSANLLLVNIKDYNKVGPSVAEIFTQKKIPGVYVTINKPYSDLIKTFPSALGNIHFVDVITAMTGRAAQDTPHVTYLDSPLGLVEVNVAISEQLEKIVSNQKFLFLDSVSTLLVYNSPQAVEKFCHAVIARNRTSSVIGLFLMIETEDHRAVIETLGQFVDQTIAMK